jgi:hypothetical protein
VRAQRPSDSNPARSDARTREVLRAYLAPKLVEYGSVAKLTQTGGMTAVDFFFNLRRMGM